MTCSLLHFILGSAPDTYRESQRRTGVALICDVLDLERSDIFNHAKGHR